MTQAFDHAKILYQILPSVYRGKDNGDLEKYMQVCGALLDQVHQTLHQRYADNFPDADENDPEGLSSQPWLLPYFAKLLDVHLVSPTEAGQREEIANAISWRKGKGTLAVIEQIAQAVGGYEVVVQEGWRRVAVTPQVDMKLIPATAYGYEDDTPAQPPSLAARHPGLPAATVDFRRNASATPTESSNPAVQVSHYRGGDYYWRQQDYHGRPCNPGGFDDPTRRTPDMRTLDWRQGYYHPQHLLLFRPFHGGFFSTNPDKMVPFSYADELFTKSNDTFTVQVSNERIIVRNTSLDTDDFKPIKIRNRVKVNNLQLPEGVDPAQTYHWRFEGFYFEHTLELPSGHLELEQCAVFAINDNKLKPDNSTVLEAKDCLFNKIELGSGELKLTFCTVLRETIAAHIQVSDCLFMGLIRGISNNPDAPRGCIRYSAILPNQETASLKLFPSPVIKQSPVFCSNEFATWGAGVLHPATAKAIKNGAEDGTEMGAYHHLYLTYRDEALLKKLQDYLPFGVEAAVIPDQALNTYLSTDLPTCNAKAISQQQENQHENPDFQK